MTASADELARTDRLGTYLHEDPGNIPLRVELLDALVRAGQVAQAVEVASQGLDLVPGEPQFLYLRAVASRHAGVLDAARQDLIQLLEGGTDAAAVRLELARVHMEEGTLEAGLDVLSSLDPVSQPPELGAEVVFLQLRAWHRLGELERAMAAAQAFLRVVPGHIAISAALGTLYLDADQVELARPLYLQSLEGGSGLHPEMAAVGGFVALHDGEADEALRLFVHSAQQWPQFGRAWLGHGLAEAARGHLPEAKSALARATQLMPTHLGSWHALAWMQLSSHDLDGADQSFGQALDRDRTFADTYGGQAIVAALRGERQQAEELVRVAQRLDSRSMNAGVARQLLEQHGDLSNPAVLQQSMEMLKQHLSTQPSSLWDGLGRLLKQSRR